MNKIIQSALALSVSLFLFTACDKTSDNDGKDSAQKESEQHEKDGEDQGQEKPEEKPEISLVDQVKPPKVVKKYNDLAQFIAGYQPAEGSTYADLASNQGWKNFKAYADNTWAKIDGKLKTIATWREAQLKDANNAGGTVFYPFSGADFMHVSMFFPGANQYVMIGLEPIGNIPDPHEIKNLNGYFMGIRRTLYAIMELSFFRTIAMANDFTGKTQQKLDGTLPVLLFFLARTNHDIQYIEKVAINPEGKLLLAEGYKGDETTIYGNKIYFVNKDQPNTPKTLTYFQANIGDKEYHSRSAYHSKGLEERKDLFNFLNNLKISSTYLKSASYLMHRSTFSKVRGTIIDHSKYCLQDDSGIPVRFFEQDKWDRTFYGSYYAPIHLFRMRVQKDLRAFYAQKQHVKPLPFGIGYQYQKGTSNLMLAKKK